MGNCNSTHEYCAEFGKDDILDASPDVVGPGALAAFLATAICTVYSIRLAYLTDGLHEDLYNGVDTVFLEWVQRRRLYKGSVGTGLKIYQAFAWVFRWQGDKPKLFTLSRDQKVEAFEKTFLLLSDQQLVTGTAILIAGFRNVCTFSIYEMNCVVALAWFSATTHLASTDVLQKYLLRNEIVHKWRFRAMYVLAALLVAGLIFTSFFQPSNSPRPYQCQPSNGQFIVLAVFPSILTTAYLIEAYMSRAFTAPEVPLAWAIPVYLAYYNSGVKARVSKQKLIADRPEYLKKFKEERFEQWEKSMHDSPVLRLLTTLWIYDASFLSRIADLSFAFNYGITQLVIYRFIKKPPLSDRSKEMEFGQIVPLVLLALPLLGFFEIVCEKKENATELVTVSGASQTPQKRRPGRPEKCDKRQQMLNDSNLLIVFFFVFQTLAVMAIAVLLNLPPSLEVYPAVYTCIATMILWASIRSFLPCWEIKALTRFLQEKYPGTQTETGPVPEQSSSGNQRDPADRHNTSDVATGVSLDQDDMETNGQRMSGDQLHSNEHSDEDREAIRLVRRQDTESMIEGRTSAARYSFLRQRNSFPISRAPVARS